MSNYEFWDELGKIFSAVVAYQEKSVEFNKRFIHPWIRLGNVFDQNDRNTEAVSAYQKAIELDPANAQNWYELGNVHFRMKHYDEAAEAYQRAIDMHPESGWAHSNLALTLATQGKHIEAVPLYQKSIELIEENRDKAVAWNRLGNVYRKLNEYELALHAFQKADELDAENAGFRDELDEVSEGPTLVEGAPPAAADVNALKAMAESTVVQAGAAQAAVEATAPEIPELAPVEPIEVEALSTEPAPAVEPAPEPDPVVEAASEALKEDATPEPGTPVPAPAWVTQPLEQKVEQDSEAEGSFALEDTQPMAALRATALHAAEHTPAAGEPEPAAAIAEIVVEELAVAEAPEAETPAEVAIVDPAQSYDEIVVTDEAPIAVEPPVEAPADLPATEPEAETGAVIPAEAAPAEAPAIEAPPETEEELPVPEHAAYDEYLKDNETPFQAQVEELDEAAAEGQISAGPEPVATIDASGDVQIEMDTRNAHVWNELGNVYFNTGAFDDAIAAYTKAIELDRWFAWPYSNLALAYMQKGRFAEAILLYQRSIELFANDKDKAVSWNRLGNVYRRLNDYDNAIAAYQRADELDPENATLSLQSRFSLLGTFSVEQKPSYAA